MGKPEEIEKEVSNMLVVDKRFNQSLYRKAIITLMISVLGIIAIAHALLIEHPSTEIYTFSQAKGPLLLDSGVVETKEAELSIIVWFEDGDTLQNFCLYEPMPNWKWDYKELQAGSGKTAVTLSGHHLINKNEERNLYKWYTNIAQQVSKMGGQIYLDERVPQRVDVSAFLSQANASPSQWALLGNTVSIAAFQDNLKTSVIAGNDRINIQLLSRGKDTEGQTVLAIPALLEEF